MTERPDDSTESWKTLALDAVSALHYIEDSYGRLYGVGWDRVFNAAKLLGHTSKEENQ